MIWKPRKPLKISTKVYTGAHVQDVGNEEVGDDSDTPVVDNVGTGSFTAPLNIMTIMAFDWVQIRKKRIKIVKLLKKLKSENQLVAMEACIKNFIDNYEELVPSSSSSSSDESSWSPLHLLRH